MLSPPRIRPVGRGEPRRDRAEAATEMDGFVT